MVDANQASESAQHRSEAASPELPVIAMIGAGNMTGAILSGLTRPGQGSAEPVRVTNRSAASAAKFDGDERVRAFAAETDPRANAHAVEGAGLVLIGVKPYQVADVLDEIHDALEPGVVIISVAAGIPLAKLEEHAPAGARVVRAMPNTPATIGLGVTGIAGGAAADEEALALARAVFGTVGEVVEVAEGDEFDALAAVAGSGPAHVYLLVEEMERAAQRAGLDAAKARALVVGTMRGAIEMVARTPDVEPSELRRRVTSPNGTTEQSIAVLQAGGLEGLFARAFEANMARTREIAAENA